MSRTQSLPDSMPSKMLFAHPARKISTLFTKASAGLLVALALTGAAQAVNHQPTISAPLGSTNGTTLSVGQGTTFQLAATDQDNDSLNYSYDYGDGTAPTNLTPFNFGIHVFTVPGRYTVTCTVSDGVLTNSSSQVMTINVAVAGIGTTGGDDGDGDGFADQLEKDFTNSTNDTPFGNAKVATPASAKPFSVTRKTIKLDFKSGVTNGDTMTFSGEMYVAGSFDPSGKSLRFDIGGITGTFAALDARGKGVENFGTFKLSGHFNKINSAAKSIYKFTLSFKKSGFAAALLDDGFTTGSGKTAITLPVTLIFNDSIYQQNVPVTYKAKVNVGGVGN